MFLFLARDKSVDTQAHSRSLSHARALSLSQSFMFLFLARDKSVDLQHMSDVLNYHVSWNVFAICRLCSLLR
jgi:hypothetical protein